MSVRSPEPVAEEEVRMSISSMAGMSSSPSTSLVPGGFRPAMQHALGAVAAKLGMSIADLQTQMHSGQSLADIASANGLSRPDLISTIKGSLSSSGIPRAGLETMITRIANHQGGQHPETDSTQSGQSTGATSGADKDGDNDGR